MSASKDLREMAAELIEESADLIKKADLLDSGEILAVHYWSGDPGYEVYCSGDGCDTHIMEARGIEEVPLFSSAFCHECAKTDEERENERARHETAIREKELKTLAQLKEKYDVK